ncbi:hypothetical protein Q4595_09350 [Wenyingzhuangia sp. 1_MG-2023]|nr:hypothetical protein [Wenyingzhuangia sp. 1_MG-2023]
MISENISFLQSIYIQQDLMRELLSIFNYGELSNNLNNDENFAINREIRNELVGHPLGSWKNNLKSTAVFSYNPKPGFIEYHTYAKKNNYNLEMKSISMIDIINRHNQFMNDYLDIILCQIEKNLKNLKKEIEVKLEHRLQNLSFEDYINLLSSKFESILQNHWYSQEILLTIYQKREEHDRYKNAIEDFTSNLEFWIKDTKAGIDSFLLKFTIENGAEPQIDNKAPNVILSDTPTAVENKLRENLNNCKTSLREVYNPNIDSHKLNSKFNSVLFFSPDNKGFKNEIEHMKNNIEDKAEYISSYLLANKILQSIIDSEN